CAPYFFAGDVAADGLALAAAAGDAAGVAAVVEAGALAASEDAGRNPRFEGLANMFAAKLLTTFASDNATSSKAAFKIFLRCSVKAALICCRTFGLSRVRFSVASRFSCNFKIYQRLLISLGSVKLPFCIGPIN